MQSTRDQPKKSTRTDKRWMKFCPRNWLWEGDNVYSEVHNENMDMNKQVDVL